MAVSRHQLCRSCQPSTAARPGPPAPRAALACAACTCGAQQTRLMVAGQVQHPLEHGIHVNALFCWQGSRVAGRHTSAVAGRPGCAAVSLAAILPARGHFPALSHAQPAQRTRVDVALFSEQRHHGCGAGERGMAGGCGKGGALMCHAVHVPLLRLIRAPPQAHSHSHPLMHDNPPPTCCEGAGVGARLVGRPLQQMLRSPPPVACRDQSTGSRTQRAAADLQGCTKAALACSQAPAFRCRKTTCSKP